MSFGFGSLINIGASLLGGALDRNAARRQNNFSNSFAREQFEWQKNRIQNTVADAKKAGIHPLFALGSSAGISPVSVAGGTGASMGSSIANAGQALGGMFGKKGNPLQAKQGQLLDAQIRATNAEALYREAEVASMNQNQLVQNQARDMFAAPGLDGFSVPGAGFDVPAVTTPLRTRRSKPGTRFANTRPPRKAGPIGRRKVERVPSSDSQLVGTTTLPSGKQIPWVNPNTGIDEPAEILNFLRLIQHGPGEAWRRWVANKKEEKYWRDLYWNKYGGRKYLPRPRRKPLRKGLISR